MSATNKLCQACGKEIASEDALAHMEKHGLLTCAHIWEQGEDYTTTVTIQNDTSPLGKQGETVEIVKATFVCATCGMKERRNKE